MLDFKIVNSEKDYETCIDIRKQVFIIEQNVPKEIEIDELESVAVHFLIHFDKIPVATARLIKIAENCAKIGRVAVLKDYRGKNIGNFLMKEIIEYSRKDGAKTILLSSQVQALGFYEKLGFTAYGNEFMDADIPHYMMRLDFD